MGPEDSDPPGHGANRIEYESGDWLSTGNARLNEPERRSINSAELLETDPAERSASGSRFRIEQHTADLQESVRKCTSVAPPMSAG